MHHLPLGMARYMGMCTQPWKTLLLENANWYLADDYLPCSWDSYSPELAQNFIFRPSFASGNNGGQRVTQKVEHLQKK